MLVVMILFSLKAKVQIPYDYIPEKWSDFSFWTEHLPRNVDMVMGESSYSFNVSAVPVNVQEDYLNLGTGLIPEYVILYFVMERLRGN